MDTTRNARTLSHAQKIEQTRKLMGISQTELGKRLGISKQAVTKMERTEKISEKRMTGIAKALDVPTGAITGLTQERLFFHIQNMTTVPPHMRIILSAPSPS